MTHPALSNRLSNKVAASPVKLRRPSGCLQRVARRITGSMEILFYRIGYAVGFRPWWTLLGALILSGILGGGLVFWREERDKVALWTTDDSRIRRNAHWVDNHFTDDVRYESVIIAADNVLRPDVLIYIAELDQHIKNMTTAKGHGWTDVCARYGISHKHRQQKRETTPGIFDKLSAGQRENFSSWTTSGGSLLNSDLDIDLSLLDFSNVFAASGDSGNSLLGSGSEHLLNAIGSPDSCLFRNILQIWNGDLQRIKNATVEQILREANVAIRSSEHLSDAESIAYLLSDIEKNAEGDVIRAGATLVTWLVDNDKKNATEYDEWEREFVQRTVHSNSTLPPGVKLYTLATRSYDDAIVDTLGSDLRILTAGFSLIILYVAVSLGRFNCVQQRCLLSVAGVSVVGLAIIASYGLCFYMGVFYGPVHPILPFLLLGIGVDDMFVIIQALDNLTAEERKRSVPERIGLTMKHAGVSVTVTSVTDIVAFAIGATTGMPALRSFCINATTGILILFLLVVTFFAAITAIDERRQESLRDGFFFRKQKEKWQPSQCSRKEMLKFFFDKFYSPFLFKTPVKVMVLVVTAVFVGVNTWGILQLERNFDPNWYLKEGSYPMQYFNAMKQYFPENGERAAIYVGRIDYIDNTNELNRMVDLLRKNIYVKSTSVKFWHEEFQLWLNNTRKVGFPSEDKNFKSLLQEFLFSPEGRQFVQDIKIEGSIFDSPADYNITASRVRFSHLALHNSTLKNFALESILSLEEEIFFGEKAEPSYPSPFTYVYIEWEANKVISNELIRNLGLTMLAVLIVTLVLIADLITVVWVFTCIAFTLVDVLGLMYFWGLTVEIVTSIIIILAAGLAVDYAAHIGHTFTTLYGSRSKRARVTLSRMGPAVWNGGFSTFLAFVLLANSDSYVFTTFFKLFFSVVVFGLFHGLAYLPVILSWFGPSERTDASIDGDAPSIDATRPPISKQISIYVLGNDNPAGFADGQFAKRSDILNRILMEKNRSWPRGAAPANQDEPPFIPQPDYTPLPRRRDLAVPESTKSLASITESETEVSDIGQRVWHHPQWVSASSQFDARKWSSALAKRLSMEAQRRHADRAEKLRTQIGEELDRFESEMDSYLGNSASGSQAPEAEVTPSGTSGSTSGTPKPTNDDDSRDQESLESGYMSSYVGRRY